MKANQTKPNQTISVARGSFTKINYKKFFQWSYATYTGGKKMNLGHI